MPKKHTVQQGECVSSIGFAHGFFWETLWSDPGNAALKESRDSAFVLKPGDVVHVPDLRERQVDVGTGARHTFRRKGVPAKLRMRLLSMNKPLANQPFVLAYAGREVRGTTDENGMVELFVPPDVGQATLRVGEGKKTRIYNIAPRTLNPSREIDGVQARLANLGYYDGPIHGELDDVTVAAIRRFQSEHDLEVTGQADEATSAALLDLHTSAG